MKNTLSFSKADVASALAAQHPQYFPNGPAEPVRWYSLGSQIDNVIEFEIDEENVHSPKVPVLPCEYDAFYEGVEAYRDSARIGNNPYDRDTFTHEMWRRGFLYAKVSSK